MAGTILKSRYGYTKKENKKMVEKVKGKGEERRNRKKEFREIKNNVCKVVLPFFAVFAIIICFIVYIFTRPKPRSIKFMREQQGPAQQF